MILIIKTKWNHSITESLAKAAEKELTHSSYSFETIEVPGALEIPLAIKWAFEKWGKELEAAIACGCVIKGDTYHFEIVANESARALVDLTLETGLPIANSIICAYDTSQALDRAKGEKNKGIEGAQSAVEMLRLKKQKEF